MHWFNIIIVNLDFKISHLNFDIQLTEHSMKNYESNHAEINSKGL